MYPVHVNKGDKSIRKQRLRNLNELDFALLVKFELDY